MTARSFAAALYQAVEDGTRASKVAEVMAVDAPEFDPTAWLEALIAHLRANREIFIARATAVHPAAGAGRPSPVPDPAGDGHQRKGWR